MDIESLQLVALVAKNGSFAATARVLDVDPSSVSRTVAQVEDYLGVLLFQRSTRSLSPTAAGERYLADITPLLEEFERARNSVLQSSAEPMGVLKMTTSVSFAHACVIPYLSEFAQVYPRLEIELQTTDANIDLVAENIDLAVRLAPVPKGDLICTKLMTTRYVVCASPEYVATHSSIKKPDDLQHHHCIRFALPDYRNKWQFRQPNEPVKDVAINGKLVISNALSLRKAVLHGMGPALLPDWLIKNDLALGKLLVLLPQYDVAATSFDTAAWALYPSRSYLPLKVRVMLDFLREKLR